MTSKIANYPNGFANGIAIRGVPITQMHPGQVFWVSNSTALLPGQIGGSDSNKGTFDQPFATVDYAVGRCVANRGDIVMVKPGHAETIASATALAIDVAGVAVVGLGVGSNRPTFNLTATTSTIAMSAANCTFWNCLVTGGIDAIVAAITVSAADCRLQLNYRDVTGQCTDCVLTTAAADRLYIDVNDYDGATAAGTNAGIAIVGGDHIEIVGRYMDGNFAVGGIDIRTTATTDLFVHDFQYFRTRNAADIFLVDTITASTGQVGPNINIRLNDNAANITEAVTGATFVVQDPVYVVNLAGEKGMLINWTASTDA
jgi:hypothetical protein